MQRPADSLTEELWDLLVVGAGPAGSTCAMTAAAKGLRVLLLDGKGFPREKVCGDGLIPDSIACLRRLGLFEEVRAASHFLDKVSLFSPSRAELRLRGEFLTIERRRLDALLARTAVGRGATFALGRAVALSEGSDGRISVALARTSRVLKSKLVALATGADVSLAQSLGFVSRREPSAVAARCYVTSPIEIDSLVIAYDGPILPGYGWIFPLGGGLYNVGVGTVYRNGAGKSPPLGRQFETFTTRFPLAVALMAEAEGRTQLRGAAIRFGLNGASARKGGILAIGEVVGTTFPFTGEGIGKAMETGEIAGALAAEALSLGRPELLDEFSERVESGLRSKYRGYEAAQRYFARPRLADFVLRRASKSAYLREVFQGVVNETADPSAIFTPVGFLKALMR